SHAERHSRLFSKLPEQSCEIHRIRRYKRDLLHPFERTIQAERESGDRWNRVANWEVGRISCLPGPPHPLLHYRRKLTLRCHDLSWRPSLLGGRCLFSRQAV